MTGLRANEKGSDHSKKQVVCIETGEVYDSVKDAADKLELSYQYLCFCIYNDKAYHGYHFKQLKEEIDVK